MGGEITDRVLANSHYSVFAEWIASSLAHQKADLDHYLRDRGSLNEIAAYRNLLPTTVHEVERQLFASDLETLLAILRLDSSGGVLPTPRA